MKCKQILAWTLEALTIIIGNDIGVIILNIFAVILMLILILFMLYEVIIILLKILKVY